MVGLVSFLLLGNGSFAQAPASLGNEFIESEVLGRVAIPSSPSYERAAEPLRQAPPVAYDFSQGRLGDIFRLMAKDAGISFFSLPEESEESDRIVTFTVKAPPFIALETLARANGVALIYSDSIWYLRPSSDNELIARTYQIKFNPQEVINQSESGGGGVQSAGTTTGGTGSSGGGTGGLSLGGASRIFETEPSKILDDIKELLDIETTTSIVNTGAEFGVGDGVSAATLPQQVEIAVRDEESSTAPGAKVIFNPDANTIYVVANRAQHQWIEGYLEAVDRPQPLIAVEVKFFETTKDPRRQIGVDWTGMFGEGYGLNVDGLSTPEFNIGNIASSFQAPQSAILSAAAAQASLNLLARDSEVTSVSYPRVVTMNNREVVIRSVINQPVLSSSSSTSSGGASTDVASVDYLPIGTIINVLPKKMVDGAVLLNTSITVSSIIGSETIGGESYPIASSRIYSAALKVGSGNTVAIGGLDEATTTESDNGIIGLRKIPILGAPFRNKDKSRSRKNLLIFLTPTVLSDDTAGLPDRPQYVETDPAPPVQEPRWNPDGSVQNTPENRRLAAQFFARELELLGQLVQEGIQNEDDSRKLKFIQSTVHDLLDQVRYEMRDASFRHDRVTAAALKAEERDLLQLQSIALELSRDNRFFWLDAAKN
ncbi:MAG: hypothetical protein AAF555_02210 [Verrucomicrobiota bacterium]